MTRPALMSSRIGRFKGQVGKEGANPEKKMRIIYRPNNQLYRVINPRERLSTGPAEAFGLKYDGTSGPPVNVTTGSTLDFFVSDAASAVDVTHQHPLGTGLESVRGMYTLIGNDRAAPSGRFEYENTDPHMVIDLRLAPSGRKATYRFLNSGKKDLVVSVRRIDGTLVAQEIKVKKRLSADVTLTGRQYVEVSCEEAPCKGIYEFLDVR